MIKSIRKNLKLEEDNSFDVNDCDDIESAIMDLSYIKLEHGDPNCGSTIYLGLSWDEVKDDETGLQFKNKIEFEIEKLIGKKVKCATHSEAWYDG
jgi:hypothetical protein